MEITTMRSGSLDAETMYPEGTRPRVNIAASASAHSSDVSGDLWCL
jgi:hypothetical protein